MLTAQCRDCSMLRLTPINSVALFAALLAASGALSETQPSFYHKTDEILEFFRKTALKLPQRVRYETIPDPESNANLPVVSISDFSNIEASKETILLVAGEHARELITAEVSYWLGVLLSGQEGELDDWAALQQVQAQLWKTGATKTTVSEWAQSLLQTVVFKLVPIVNLSGRKAAESGSTCQRKTVSGVDLNRNWPFAWQQISIEHEEYGGPKPFSEPESRIVKLVAEGAHAQAYVNLHAGEWAMYMPWDSQQQAAPGLPADISDLLEKLNTHCECMSGPAGQVAGYLAHGTSMDYMFHELHVPYSLTFEVYGPDGLGKLAKGAHPRRLQQTGNQSAIGAGDTMPALPLLREHAEGAGVREEVVETSAQRCLRDYNPLGVEEYQDTVARWLGALLVLAAHLAANPTASAAAHDAGQSQLPLPPVKPTKQDLVRMGQTAAEEHQHPQKFVQDARRHSLAGAWRRPHSPLPVTSSNKSLPVHRGALETSHGSAAGSFHMQPWDHAQAGSGALAMLFGGWSWWGGLALGGVVTAAVVLWLAMGRAPLRWSRRKGTSRRPQRYQV